LRDKQVSKVCCKGFILMRGKTHPAKGTAERETAEDTCATLGLHNSGGAAGRSCLGGGGEACGEGACEAGATGVPCSRVLWSRCVFIYIRFRERLAPSGASAAGAN
jgi:hypothetical protein